MRKRLESVIAVVWSPNMEFELTRPVYGQKFIPATSLVVVHSLPRGFDDVRIKTPPLSFFFEVRVL